MKFWLIIILIILNAGLVSSMGIIGVSPADVRFEGLLRGGYAERMIAVSSSSSDPINITLEPLGEIKDWVNVSLKSFILSGETGRVLISILPPDETPNGNYTGFVRIMADPSQTNGVEGHAMGAVHAAIDLSIVVTITDKEIRDCSIKGVSISSVEKGDLAVLNILLSNKGNVRINPRFGMDLWDQDKINSIDSLEFNGPMVLPTRTDSLNFSFPTNKYDFGQYLGVISAIDCYSSDNAFFEIFEPGVLRAQGVMKELTGAVWVSVGETIPINAVFKNVGQRDVDAQFRGKITLNDKIVQILESEKINVAVGDSDNFTFYFTPKKAGKYIASGRVYYANKKTFELSTVINAINKNSSFMDYLLVFLYIVVSLAVLFLLYKIHVGRKAYIEKMRALKLR